VARPLAYYDNNVGGTVTLLRAMAAAQVQRFVFSSSATVYGAPDRLPITEDAPIRTTNPYGATKAMVEQVLRDLAAAMAAGRSCRCATSTHRRPPERRDRRGP